MIYVFNPSPMLLELQVNYVTLTTGAPIAPPPNYTPIAGLIPYGVTGDGPPPDSYPDEQVHFVPGKNTLFTRYHSIDPQQPHLGLRFNYSFELDTPVTDDLVIYCLRGKIWILNHSGSILNVVTSQ